MPNIDLKILFGVDVKDSDFERVNAQLNKIQDNANRLNEAFNRAGAQGTSGFSRFADQFTSMGRITDAIKNVNALAASVETLAKTQGSLAGLMRSLSDVGRSINENMGENKSKLMRQYSVEVDSLRDAASSRLAQSSQAEAMAARAESMGDSAMAAQYRKLANMRGMEARQALDAYNHNTFIRPLQNAGAAMLRGAGGALALSQLPGQLAGAYDDMFEFAPQRGEIAMRAYYMQQGTQAASGNVTGQVLRNLGLGQEASGLNNFNTQMRDAAVIVGRFAQGLLGSIPLVGSLLGGGRTFQTVDSLFAERMGQRRGLDMSLYSPLLQSAGELQLDRASTFNSVYRGADVNSINSILLRANRAGISDAMLGPVAGITAARGLNFSQTAMLALRGQQLGMDPGMFEQLLRYTSRNGNAGDIFSNIMGATGVQTLGGAQAASAVLGQVLGNATGNFSAGQVSQLVTGAVSGAVAGRGNIPEPEVVGPAAAVGAGIQSMANRPGNFVSAGIDMSLINMGVTNPVLRMSIASAVSQGKFNEAARAVAAAKGQAGDANAIAAARRQLAGVFGSYLDTTSSLVGNRPSDRAAFSEVGADPEMFLMTGQTVPGGGTIAGIRGAVDQIANGETPGGTARTFSGPELELQSAQAQRQAAIVEGVQKVTGDLGRGILNEIATGFRQIGLNITSLADRAKEEIDKNAKEQVTSTRRAAEPIRVGPGPKY